MSRTPFKPSPEQRARVKSLAAVGTPQEDIAMLVGCSAKTLRKHFRHELDTGLAEATAVIAAKLLELVNAGNVGAQIFWAKVHGRGRNAGTTAGPEAGATDDDPPRVVIIMPDNGREPDATEWAEGVWAEAEALVKEKAARKQREAERYRARRRKPEAGDGQPADE